MSALAKPLGNLSFWLSLSVGVKMGRVAFKPPSISLAWIFVCNTSAGKHRSILGVRSSRRGYLHHSLLAISRNLLLPFPFLLINVIHVRFCDINRTMTFPRNV